jgi:hypothetical protein
MEKGEQRRIRVKKGEPAHCSDWSRLTHVRLFDNGRCFYRVMGQRV